MGGGGSARGRRVERRIEGVGLAGSGTGKGAWPVGVGDGRPGVAACVRAEAQGGPVGVGRGWSIAMGWPKRAVPFGN
jgi:hypothetical protein